MTVVRRAAIAALLLLPAAAAARGVYAADDPAAPLKERVEQLMGLYLVEPPRRHSTERVRLEGGKVRITYWQTVGDRTDEELVARALRWFVFGRTQYATGVRGIFSEMPAVEEVSLVFEEVVRPERKGRRRGAERVHPYLELRLTRAKFERLDPARVKRCAERGRCLAVAREVLDAVRLDHRYLRRARRADP